MQKLNHLLLGITGGIAAYKSAELLRLLTSKGISVQVVMTEAACQFITPATMQALSGKPVFTSQWEGNVPNGMPHIDLSRNMDAILVAPASADFISKIAHGSANDLLSALCLARNCPLLIAPSMNKHMWENPATQRNIQQLVNDNILVLGPDSGDQACGENGPGRMLDPLAIMSILTALNQPKLFQNKRILITAGPTIESIDPVRGITNFSSGKMGYCLAQAALEVGAEVTLISGPTSLEPPSNCKLVHVRSAQDMFNEVKNNLADQDIFISVAAVADYRPANPSLQKIKKNSKVLTIDLIENPDILAYVAGLSNPPFCVGFAAESENIMVHAEEKRQKKKLPVIVVNHTSVMGQDHSQITILDDEGTHSLAPALKIDLARELLDFIHHKLQLSD